MVRLCLPAATLAALPTPATYYRSSQPYIPYACHLPRKTSQLSSLLLTFLLCLFTKLPAALFLPPLAFRYSKTVCVASGSSILVHLYRRLHSAVPADLFSALYLYRLAAMTLYTWTVLRIPYYNAAGSLRLYSLSEHISFHATNTRADAVVLAVLFAANDTGTLTAHIVRASPTRTTITLCHVLTIPTALWYSTPPTTYHSPTTYRRFYQITLSVVPPATTAPTPSCHAPSPSYQRYHFSRSCVR